MVIVGTALVAVLALPSAAWAANPLALTKTIPNGGATEVAPTANVKAYFNHDMRATTVTASTFKIRKQGTTSWLGATRSINNTISPTSTNGGSQSVVTLNPNANLAFNTTYQVVVVGDSSGVKDADGKALSTNKSWTFTATTLPKTTIDSGPEGTVASDSASFSFSSSKSGSTFECSRDGSAFSGCTSPQSYTGMADGSHTFLVRAIDARGNADRTPASRSWTVDTIGPNAVITDGPPSQFNSRSATFTFAGAEDGGGYECKIDGASSEGTFAACSSGETFTVEADGTYNFSVKASDALGNFGAPVSHTWTVDTVGPAAPSVHLDANSNSGSQSDNLTREIFPTISGTAEGATWVKIYDAENNWVGGFWIGVSNDGTWSHTLDPLTPDGTYSFTVKAIDAAGNESQEGTSISLTIDTTPPETTLGDKPASLTNSDSATFTFSSSESGSTFMCNLDNVGFNCASPQTVPWWSSFLIDGSHTFQVYATDAAGNTDPSGPTHTWTVDTIAPTVSSVTPANTATGVALSTNVTATFSEAMASNSISDQTFTLTPQNSTNPVEAVVSYDAITKKATLDPSSDLAWNTTYTATIKGGSNGVKDLAGNTLAQDRSWTFTTKFPVEVTPSPLDFTPGFSTCNTTITKTVTITNLDTSQVDLYPSVTNPHYSVASDALHIPSGESLSLSISWTAPSSGFKIRDPGRLNLRDAESNIMGAGDLTALINCGIDGGLPL